MRAAILPPGLHGRAEPRTTGSANFGPRPSRRSTRLSAIYRDAGISCTSEDDFAPISA